MEPPGPGLLGARACLDVLRGGSQLALLHGSELLGEALGRLGPSDHEATKSSLAALRDCLTRLLLPSQGQGPDAHQPTSNPSVSRDVSHTSLASAGWA
jgi:hypothetical protein